MSWQVFEQMRASATQERHASRRQAPVLAAGLPFVRAPFGAVGLLPCAVSLYPFSAALSAFHGQPIVRGSLHAVRCTFGAAAGRKAIPTWVHRAMLKANKRRADLVFVDRPAAGT